MITLRMLSPESRTVAQHAVTEHHYLRKPVDVRCMPEAYAIHLDALGLVPGMQVGYFIVGRPEATRCYPWYGSVEDVESGRAEVTRWQVLNLARVWLKPVVQPGSAFHTATLLPGFIDRSGQFRSTLASEAIRELADRVRTDYLLMRPPCFLDEPYELRYLLSYCDTRLHRGTIYRAAGFELYRTGGGASGTIDTYRLPLDPLDEDEREIIVDASRTHPRSIKHRAKRAQTQLIF